VRPDHFIWVFSSGANEGAENEAKLFGQKQRLNQKLRFFQATTFTKKYNFFFFTFDS